MLFGFQTKCGELLHQSLYFYFQKVNAMDYITSVRKQFIYYKTLGEKAIDQLEESQLFIQKNEESNSIAVIISHLAGNMLSRWTDVLTTDGEKPWRNRDAEFENILSSKIEVMNLWNKGWTCLFVALDSLTEKDLDTIIYIRHEGLLCWKR